MKGRTTVGHGRAHDVTPRAPHGLKQRSVRAPASSAGYTLVELMVATAITTVVIGSVLAVVLPAQQSFAVQPEAADVQQRLRVAVDRLSRDVRTSGGRPIVAPATADELFAPVLPYRVGAVASDPASGVYFRPGVLSVVSLVQQPDEELPQRVSRTYFLRTTGPDVSHLMQYDGGQGTFPVLDDVVGLDFALLGERSPPDVVEDASGDPERVSYGPPLPGVDDPLDEWAPGENCGWSLIDGALRSRMTALGAGEPVVLDASQLVDGPWCPSAADPNRFDLDLLRVRIVRVRLRVQARRAFRGARGPLFVNPGIASGGRQVPDLEIRFDVSPRSLVP